ncbi:hypothetical protein ACIBED_13485 [Rhodococcus coprophilus]|uniref:Secreted protein n=1 Tax=Rhodococcus coprophilus TaxID=38310 RepID=A0A2X4UAJ2_9NOCA|nr:hypothetical protein [Rhodococcus coprophilus]MBM7459484.1 hypothetical protein [Rhodococcus coprophilus]SQI36193.1 Uncharacterised protein [Rhodococcus coprophilus]
MNHRTRAFAAAVVAAVLALAAPSTALGDELPTDGPTITITITNDTDAPMVLAGKCNPYGRWIDEPAAVVSARASETVTAVGSDRRGFGVQVSYTMPGEASVVLMANDFGTGPANPDGTRVAGANRHGYSVEPNVDTGYPFMTMNVVVARP